MPSIIPQPRHALTWQQELAQSFTHPVQLLKQLGLPLDMWDGGAEANFHFRVPRPFAQRMRPGDPNDPLLRQVLPRAEENLSPAGFVSDPVGDGKAQVVPGVLHKYEGRALLIVTGACAIHCRYCFRREFPYEASQFTSPRQQAALDYLRKDSSIEEVILSGGDPLSVSNRRLQTLVRGLEDIPHLRRLRIHTRLPVVLPARVDPGLLEILSSSRFPTVLVLHINHANEIDAAVREAARLLRRQGVHLLNQSTLLAGVNDSVTALVALQKQSFEAGVLPYYLHLLDRARGTAHFDVPEIKAKHLHEDMRRRLPGYLVPRLARDLPGQPYKLLI